VDAPDPIEYFPFPPPPSLFILLIAMEFAYSAYLETLPNDEYEEAVGY